ncbi:response regulator [Pelomyxa schiedti]|nr:response regulator [Pelomyxa schiedti]
MDTSVEMVPEMRRSSAGSSASSSSDVSQLGLLKKRIPAKLWMTLLFVFLIMIPLLIVTCAVVVSGGVAISQTYAQQTSYMKSLAEEFLGDSCLCAANEIDSLLSPFSLATQVLRRESILAFSEPRTPPAKELAAYGYSDNDPPYTWYGALWDYGGGDVAWMLLEPRNLTFDEIEFWVWRSGALDSHLHNLYNTFPGMLQIWIVTSTNLCRIYPYTNFTYIWPYDLDIREFDVYKLPLENNPAQETRWIPLYNDLAMGGWMTSSVAPIYDDSGSLLGVAGIDVTVTQVQEFILSVAVPWEGYPILLTYDGTILALTDQGSEEWHVSMGDDMQIFTDDTFYAASYLNVYLRNDTQELASLISSENNGTGYLNLFGERKVVSWSTVENTQMLLMFIVAEDSLYQIATEGRVTMTIGIGVGVGSLVLMLVSMLVVSVLFKRSISVHFSKPLGTLMATVDSIGHGNYYQIPVDYKLLELQQMSRVIVRVGQQLGSNVDLLRTLNISYQRFLPQAFLQTLGKKDFTTVKLGDSRECDITILFVDIRDFCSISQDLSSQELFQTLNHYLSVIGPVIERRNGFIDKFLGDGCLAIFPGSPADALKAAIDIQAAVDRLNAEGFLQGMLRVGIGLHKGPVLMGTVGHHDRMDVTVISKTVNIASRLENLTKLLSAKILTTDKVLTQESKWEQMRGSMIPLDASGITSRFVGHICPQGMTTPLCVYQIDTCTGAYDELKPHLADIESVIDMYESFHLEQCVCVAKSLLAEIDDRIVKLYLDKAQSYLRDGVPEPLRKLSLLPLVFDTKFD